MPQEQTRHEARNYHRTQMKRELIIQKLREQGCRITRQRRILLDIILEEECSCCKEIYYKDDLINILSKDHIKPIRYIFSMSDRIIVDRDIHINEKEGVLNAII